MSRYEITSLPALTLAQYTGQVSSTDEVGEVVGSLFGRLLGAMQQLSLDPEQPTIAWYGGDGAVTGLGVGLPVTGPFDSGDTGLAPGELVAVERAVVVRHEGTLEGLSRTWQELHRQLAAEGLTPTGPCREVYLAGDVSRDDAWVIDIQQPVA